MKTIKYNNKEYKLPFDVALPEDATAEDTVRNRFGGESCTLPAFAIAVYDVILGAEMLEDYKTVKQEVNIKMKNLAKQNSYLKYEHFIKDKNKNSSWL